MSIPITRYVDITSGVGGADAVSRRELMARLFTENDEMPTQTVLEFSSADDVGTYFGTTSNEYERALFYFSFVSKQINAPQTMSFYRYDPNGTPAQIVGAQASQDITEYQAIVAGSFQLSIQATGSPVSYATVSGLNFGAVVTFDDVAAIIETQVQAQVGEGTNFTSATVVYDSDNQHFDLTAGIIGAYDIEIGPTFSPTNLLTVLGWDGNEILSNGVDAQTVSDVLAASFDESTDFGSFTFNPVLTDLTDVEEAASWNQAKNVLFQFQQPVTATNAVAWSAALFDYGGTGLTLYDETDTTEFPEMGPMALLAATNYNQVGATQNYMFYQFGLTPLIENETDADFYDNLRINYNGQTQTAGSQLTFYQRGVLMGTSEDPVDMNTYANEQWLKDAATVVIMNLLLALPRLPANNQGRAQVISVVQTVADEAIINGSISVGKTLTVVQQQYITSITGDERAWYQVQNTGYYLTADVLQDAGEFYIDYLLVYSKDDAVRKVTGRHVLI